MSEATKPKAIKARLINQIDYWHRPIAEDDQGRIYVDINCGEGNADWHTTSSDMEPDYPVSLSFDEIILVRINYRPTNSISYGVMVGDGVFATFKKAEEARECIETTSPEFIKEVAGTDASLTYINPDHEVTFHPAA